MQQNISIEERKALQEEQKDQNRIIFTADKGVAHVVIDLECNISKFMEHLNKENVYK